MFRSFDFQENTPRDIFIFEGLWLMFLVLSMTVAIVMYDDLVEQMGWWGTAVLAIILVGGALTLMVYTSRHRSKLARWLLTIVSVLSIFPYLVYLFETMPAQPAGYISLLQIAVQVAAIVCLFTKMSRDWFAGRPQLELPSDDL